MACNGNCGSCGGCAKELTLTEGELSILEKLGQIPFLPAARKADSEIPLYLEDHDYSRDDYGLILLCLEKKALIDIDWRAPLAGFDYAAYAGYPVHGSIALTARGQQVLELLQLQGTADNA